MSEGSTRRPLSVAADLRLDVGGQTATLTGSGSVLTLRSATPQMFLSSLTDAALPDSIGRINGPRAVGRAAEMLRAYGLAVHIEGPDGTIAAFGAGEHSWWGRVATGSSAVRPGSFRALRSLVGTLVPLRRVLRVAAPVGTVAAVVVAAVVTARRRPSGSDQ